VLKPAWEGEQKAGVYSVPKKTPASNRTYITKVNLFSKPKNITDVYFFLREKK
jgi:hypothetical protein